MPTTIAPTKMKMILNLNKAMLDDMSTANQAAAFLTRNGIRKTPQRLQVVEELARERNDVTAGELHDTHSVASHYFIDSTAGK